MSQALSFNIYFFRLFNNGFNYKISNLFPEVELPVSRGTRGISSLIKWNHEEDWNSFAAEEYEIMLKPKSFREIAMSILGLDDSETFPLTTTLNDLGITSWNAVELQNVLEIQFNLKKSVEEIRKLTLQNLRII